MMNTKMKTKEHLGFENKTLIWYNDYIGDRGGNDHEENV